MERSPRIINQSANVGWKEQTFRHEERFLNYLFQTICKNMVVVPPKLTILDLFKVVNVNRYWYTLVMLGAQWLSSRLLDSRPRGRGFEPHRRYCVVSAWARHNNPSLVLVYPRKTRPYITEILLMGRKESNQIKTNTCDVTWRRRE